jgi:hypothetical protein
MTFILPMVASKEPFSFLVPDFSARSSRVARKLSFLVLMIFSSKSIMVHEFAACSSENELTSSVNILFIFVDENVFDRLSVFSSLLI